MCSSQMPSNRVIFAGSVSVAATEDDLVENGDSVLVIYGTTSTPPLLPSDPVSPAPSVTPSQNPRNPKSQVLPTFTVGTKKEGRFQLIQQISNF